MRTKIDCPIDFLCVTALNRILVSKGLYAVLEDPECIVVNPGTDQFLGPEYFGQFKSLKVVGTPSTGVSHIDVEYLAQNNISVKCLLDDRKALNDIHASAEFTWLHIMSAHRKFQLAINSKFQWRTKENEDYLRSSELHGKKLGIVGMGRIGRKLVKYARTFGMDVKWYDPYVDSEASLLCQISNKVKNLNDLKDCDILSVNCYLTEETKELITYGTLDDFKTGLVIVNTSRGEVVNEDYIYDLVITDEIVYSADVLCDEQDLGSLRRSKLFCLEHDGLTITPHVAGATYESQLKALQSILNLCSECIK